MHCACVGATLQGCETAGALLSFPFLPLASWHSGYPAWPVLTAGSAPLPRNKAKKTGWAVCFQSSTYGRSDVNLIDNTLQGGIVRCPIGDDVNHLRSWQVVRMSLA